MQFLDKAPFYAYLAPLENRKQSNPSGVCPPGPFTEDQPPVHVGNRKRGIMQEEREEGVPAADQEQGPLTADRGTNRIEEEQIVEPENALPEVTLEGLPESLQAACARAGWKKLLPVQARASPYRRAKRARRVQSQTGSVKTGAFTLPILERIDPAKGACQALVLVPTRELAQQVAREAEILRGDRGVRSAVVYGGVKFRPQLDAFRAGAQIVVGTPGRILDHLLKGTLHLDALQILVFDEADRMLSMGFYPDMKRVQQFLPRRPINGYMFSATILSFVLRLAGEFLRDPEFLSLSRDHVHVVQTEQLFYVVPGLQRERSLVRIIEMENPVSAIIFCNMKSTVHYVSVVLKRFGYDADELSSDLAQGAREKVMARVKKGALRFLVATDVAARGIDIPDLSHVIQYEPPEDPELYIHRAVARSFTNDLGEKALPSDEDVGTIVSQRVIASLEARLRSRDGLENERMRRFISLGRSLAEAEEESPLIAMLLDEYYQRTLQVPPQSPTGEIPEEAVEAPEGERKEVSGGKKKWPRKRSGRSLGRGARG